MLREQVLCEWNVCQELFLQLKAKSIDNYVIMNKRTILSLDNSYLDQPPVELYNIMIENGVVTKKKTSLKSNCVIEIHGELLKVAIIEDLGENLPVEEIVLTNYDASQVVPQSIIPPVPPQEEDDSGPNDSGPTGPTIEEVD